MLEKLIRQAAQGSVMHNDDTSMRILRMTREPDDKRTRTQRHRIDRECLDHRTVLYRVEACGGEHRRSLETARQRFAGANPNVRCAVAQRTKGRRNPAGELSRPWKTAGSGSGR